MFSDIGEIQRQDEQRPRGSAAGSARGVVAQQLGQLEQFLYVFDRTEFPSESMIKPLWTYFSVLGAPLKTSIDIREP